MTTQSMAYVPDPPLTFSPQYKPHPSSPTQFHMSVPFDALSMLEGKAVISNTDMLQSMQDEALRLAAKALDVFDVTDSTQIACFIKKEFDKLHGPVWQCIVGTDFGSFVTHSCGCFIYFCIGNLAILLFKGAAGHEDEEKQLTALEPVKA